MNSHHLSTDTQCSEEKLEQEFRTVRPLLKSSPQEALEKLSSIVEKVKGTSLYMLHAYALFACAEACSFLGRPREMEGYAERAAALANRLDNPYDRARILTMLGTYYSIQRNARTAIRYLTHAVELFIVEKQTNNGEYIQALISMGRSFEQVGGYEKALDFFFRGLRKAQELNYQDTTAILLMNISFVYGAVDAGDRALDFMKRACNEAERSTGHMSRYLTLKALGSLYVAHSNPKEGIPVLQKALELQEQIDSRDGDVDILIDLGKAFAQLEDYPEALQKLNIALDTAEASGFDNRLEALRNIGDVYAASDNPEAALSYYHRTLELLAGTQESVMTARLHKKTAAIYERMGDTANALRHYHCYEQLREESSDLERRRALDRIVLEQAHEDALKEWELLQLRAENAEREIIRQRNELNTATLHLARHSRMLEALREIIEQFASAPHRDARKLARSLLQRLEETVSQTDIHHLFEEHFETVYEDFITELRRRGPELTPSEIKICVLIRMNLPSKQIADLLCCSPHTIRTHRRNIRRKLPIPAGYNLTSLLLSL